MSDLGWTSKYVGIPYKRHGRDTLGADCWGIVRMALAEQFGIDLPDYSDEYPRQEDALKAIESKKQALVPISGVAYPGDLVLMRIGNEPCHIGLFVGSDYILHADPLGRQPSRMERLSRSLQLRIEGYYRVS